ncbi:YdcF family protein [Bradyrhizobium sp. CCBAU 53421]|uniref:YdcF family protein n=1 Tax=Bradyrhizobium sp. CCBAU 53421 TaxID=1325120 RepID=UPI00188BE440|nr:YdcF family protein [Bradyrhizobium sp. CCBAU 53421]QOZ34092.1 YdcF family protein [Bradyrhizobium sp. CCBAU 53421]
MFFVLSKTLGIMLLPVNFLIGIGVIGAVLLLTRFARLGRRLMVASLLLLAICGFSPLGNVLLATLEQRFPPWDASRGAPDGIIVLGGSIDADLSVAHGTPVVRSAADRVIAAAALARRYPNARLVFTGGSANLISNDAREADYAAEMLESLGIARSRLIIERRSRNTVENAEFSKVLVDPKPGERWLLVTSAYHMPRSVGLFRKAGFDVEAYPVDWRVGDVFSPATLAIEGLSRTDLGAREWIGLLAYHLAGRTDDLLPGPAAR